MKLPNPGLRSALIKKAITITPQTSILDAIEVIQKYRIGRLVVIDRTFSPIAIITDKDIMRSLWPLNNKTLDSLRVQDLMSKNLITAQKSDSIYNCAQIMKQNNISSLVILRDDKSMEGIVTKTDLVFNFLIQQSEKYKISQIMTDKVITVSTGDSLFIVESILINNKISRVPVMRNQNLVGIITYRDFIPARIPNRLGAFTDTSELRDVWYSNIPSQFNVNQLNYTLTFRAEDIMSKNPVTVEPTDDVSLAALIMYRYGISGIPVLKSGKLVGLVTKSDIVSALAKEANFDSQHS